jgi:hypothetical protein
VPWLTFLLIAAGVVAAAFVLAVLLLGRADRTTLALAAGTVLGIGAVVVAFPIGRNSVHDINGVRLMYRGTPPNQAKEKCIVDGGAAEIVPLVERLRADLPPRASYQVIGRTRTDVACLTTNMLPHVLVNAAHAGDWVVFTDGVPASWAPRLAPGSLRHVGPTLAFGRMQR